MISVSSRLHIRTQSLIDRIHYLGQCRRRHDDRNCSRKATDRIPNPLAAGDHGLSVASGRETPLTTEVASTLKSGLRRLCPEFSRLPRTDPTLPFTLPRLAPSGAGTLGNLRQGAQRSVDCGRVRKQVGQLRVNHNDDLTIRRGLTNCPTRRPVTRATTPMGRLRRRGGRGPASRANRPSGANPRLRRRPSGLRYRAESGCS